MVYSVKLEKKIGLKPSPQLTMNASTQCFFSSPIAYSLLKLFSRGRKNRRGSSTIHAHTTWRASSELSSWSSEPLPDDVSEDILPDEEGEGILEACLLLLGTKEKSRNRIRGRRVLGKRVGSTASHSRAPVVEYIVKHRQLKWEHSAFHYFTHQFTILPATSPANSQFTTLLATYLFTRHFTTFPAIWPLF